MCDVNKQLLEALKMVLDGPDSLDGRPRTYECVVEAIAAAEQVQADIGKAISQQAEPVAWEVRNGVVTHDFYKTAEDAEEVARDMQKSHVLSGSTAAFNVRPVYAKPPAVAVPDGYVLTKIPHEYAKTLVNGGWNQYADGWNACRAAMLAAAQKGGK